jgi:hypothetical protein
VNLPFADQTLPPGGSAMVQADIAYDSQAQGVTWSLSPPGAGSFQLLFNGPVYMVNYLAPGSVPSPITATLTATSVTDPSISSSVRFTTLPPCVEGCPQGGPETALISVNGGPVPGQVYRNGAFIDGVTICNPGSISGVNTVQFPVCQTVDGILVDTGSSGLRILQSQIPLLTLPTLTNLTVGNVSNTLENCYAFSDGNFVWGPVSKADVYIAGEWVSSYVGTSSPANIQVISSPVTSSLGLGIPDGCANGGVDLNAPALLGANGILGIGPEPTDCTLHGLDLCSGIAQPTPPNVYFECPKTGCLPTDTPVLASQLLFQEVENLVPLLFAPGTIISFPSVNGPQANASGTLTFASPAALGLTLTTYTLNPNNTFSTTINGQTLTNSFIDSGSNGYYFPGALPDCTVSTTYFCPSSLTPFSAMNQGSTEGQGTVNFSVDNADTLFSTYPGFAALGTLAGPDGTGTCSSGIGACTFDWGLPFFLGRQVFTRIDACPAPPNVCTDAEGPAWAY